MNHQFEPELSTVTTYLVCVKLLVHHLFSNLIEIVLQSVLEWMSYVSIGCVLGYVVCFAVGLGT